MSVRLPQKAFHAFCGVAAFAKVWSKLRLWLIARAFSVAQEAHSLDMSTKSKHIPHKIAEIWAIFIQY